MEGVALVASNVSCVLEPSRGISIICSGFLIMGGRTAIYSNYDISSST